MSIPDRQPPTKINRLLAGWPQGTVATSSWLQGHGVSRQLASQYCRYQWLSPFGHGAFIRSGDLVDWKGALYPLQREAASSLHAAGKTALLLQGYAHFLTADESAPVWLLGEPGERLPAWFTRHQWPGPVRYFTTRLFGATARTEGLSAHNAGNFSIQVAAPERAILEVLYFVPHAQGFEEARLLMEGLTTLRPRVVQSLLTACVSVKVKRLFLVLAEACGHRWLSLVDLAAVSLGSGKRVVVPGARLHPKYHVTVPDDVMPSKTEPDGP
jgi:hypothetical protein